MITHHWPQFYNIRNGEFVVKLYENMLKGE